MEKPVIGAPGPEMYGYVAGFAGREVEIYATGLFAASQLAEKHFAPSRKRRGEMWVLLAERPGGVPVTHVAVD